MRNYVFDYPRLFWRLAGLCLCLSACTPPETPQRANAIEALSSQSGSAGFARAFKPRPFVFPQDGGPHPDFQTEWWYYTGHLSTSVGRDFGYQLTFFRRGLKPGQAPKGNAWASHQLYFAHLALSDLQNQQFYAQERWQRGSLGLAGAQAQPFRVWLQNWQVQTLPDGSTDLQAQNQDFELRLKLRSLKPVVLHGQAGLSQKSPQAGNASYYYSQTRLQSEGSLKLKAENWAVKGQSWLDREWSTSVLSKQQVGWDWFSLQLDDGRELMLYQLRNRDPGKNSNERNQRKDPISSGSLIDKDGKTTPIKASDFQIEVLGQWKSPHTGVVYPSGWRLLLPKYALNLELQPRQKDQELRLSFAYWEGAVQVRGAGQSGKGYVELTGYERAFSLKP